MFANLPIIFMSQYSRKRCKYSEGNSPSAYLCCESHANDNSDTGSKSDDSPIKTMARRRIYDTFDANRDEKLTFEEIHGFLNKLRIEMSDKDVETIVGPLSTSKDGSFKFKKFVSLYESLYQDIRLRREQSPTYAAISTNNGAMGNEEAASKN